MGNIYVGVNGVARKVNKIYVGDSNGIARQVQNIYVGDTNGIARKVYTAFTPPTYSASVDCSYGGGISGSGEWGGYSPGYDSGVLREFKDVEVWIRVSASVVSQLRANGYTRCNLSWYLRSDLDTGAKWYVATNQPTWTEFASDVIDTTRSGNNTFTLPTTDFYILARAAGMNEHDHSHVITCFTKDYSSSGKADHAGASISLSFS